MEVSSFLYKHRSASIMVGLGIIAGILGGLLGIGGGAIIIPGLLFFFGLTQKKAHGTSLLCAFLISVVGLSVYSYNGFLSNNWVSALELMLGGIVGASLGAKLIKIIHSRVLKRIFCIFLIIAGLRMIASIFFGNNNVNNPLFGNDALLRGILIFLTGIITGFMSALLGIGGGMIMIPALVIGMGFNQKVAQGISLAAMVPTSFFGMILHNKMKNVDFKIGAWVGISAALFTVAGAFVAAYVETVLLKIIFGILLILVAGLMIYKKEKQSN